MPNQTRKWPFQNGPQETSSNVWINAPAGDLTALVLDRLADAELQHGHTARAEQLAELAAAMRGEP